MMIYLNIPTIEEADAIIKAVAGIGLTVGILGMLVGIWLYYRNKRVARFRIKINNLAHRVAMYFIQRDNTKMAEASRQMYDSLPSYKQMLLSLRPLELEEYVDLDTYADGKIKQTMNEIDSDLPAAQNIYRSIKDHKNE